jgi:hypothetical protein
MRTRTWAAVLAATALLAGCGGDGDDTPVTAGETAQEEEEGSPGQGRADRKARVERYDRAVAAGNAACREALGEREEIDLRRGPPARLRELGSGARTASARLAAAASASTGEEREALREVSAALAPVPALLDSLADSLLGGPESIPEETANDRAAKALGLLSIEARTSNLDDCFIPFRGRLADEG